MQQDLACICRLCDAGEEGQGQEVICPLHAALLPCVFAWRVRGDSRGGRVRAARARFTVPVCSAQDASSRIIQGCFVSKVNEVSIRTRSTRSAHMNCRVRRARVCRSPPSPLGTHACNHSAAARMAAPTECNTRCAPTDTEGNRKAVGHRRGGARCTQHEQIPRHHRKLETEARHPVPSGKNKPCT